MKAQRGKTPKKPPVPQKPKLTDPVEVYSRVRPLDNDEAVCVKVISPTSLQLTVPENAFAARNGALGKETLYTFSYVFDEYSSQKSVFDHTALPLVDDVLKGKNALLFAYGVTGSGKTHTMTGSLQDQGILPRCLDVLFNSIKDLQAKQYVFKSDKLNGFDVQSEADAMLEKQQRDIIPKMTNAPKMPGTPRVHGRHEDLFNKNKEPRVRDPSKIDSIEEDNYYGVFVSYCEIYNNYIYDLLEDLQYDPITGYKAPQSKILREDGTHNMYVSGITEVQVTNTEEAYEVLNRGQKKRKVANTALNAESSRSHSVFNIRVVQAPLDPLGEEVLLDKDQVIISQLSLVDLAGSERLQRTGNTGDRVKEAGNINQSLMVLRACIEALRENQKNGANKMVPFRDSRLTHLFKNYFDGEGKVRMIVCVNPKVVEYDETMHVMRFAELTQEVQVARPQQVQFDVGLTKGRRRLAQKYREALIDGPSDSTDSDTAMPVLYNLGPPFPPLQLQDCMDTAMLPQLADFLALRAKRRRTLIDDNLRKHEKFRESLIDLERRNQELELRVAELEAQLSNKDIETGSLQKRVKTLEKSNENLQKSTVAMQIEKREELGKRKQEERAAQQLAAKQQHQGPVTRTTTRYGVMNSFLARSEPDLTGKTPGNGAVPRTPLTHSRARTTNINRIPLRTRHKSPPPTKPKPVIKHRRSRSQGDIWLDHKPTSTIDTGCLVQPRMKKKKSVSKLDKRDMKDSNRYLLTQQELDSDGGIATKLVKGDVHHTSRGGTSVVFTEVETIKQKSPGDRKRRSPPLHPEDFTGDWTDTDERCRIAVEGHGHMKRYRTGTVV